MDEFKDITPPLTKTEEQIWEDSLFYKIDLFDHLIMTKRTDCIKQQHKKFQKRRIDENTCFACGQKGHWVKECPKKSNRSSEARKQRFEKRQLKRQVRQFIKEQRDDYEDIINIYDKEYYNPKDYEEEFDEETRKVIKKELLD